jgi:DNA-binding CsgD family transcriptional regulator
VAALAAEPERATELVRAAIAHTAPAEDTLTGVLHERLGRYLYLAGDPYSARAAYEKAVGLVPASPPTRARAAVLSGLSQILMLADHRYADSAVLAREAIEMARELPDARSVEGQARCNLGVDLAFTGQVDEGIAELHAARRIAEDQLADVDENTRALVNLNRALLFAGRLDEAVAVARESVLVCESTGLRRRWGIWCRCEVATTLLLLGRYEEAEVLLVETRAMEQHGVDAFRVDLAEGQLCSRRGELDRARQLLETARAEGERIVDPQLVGPLYASLIELAALQDDLDTALELADEGLGRVDVESVHPIYVAGFLAFAARAAARAGRDADLVEAWLDRAQACVDRTPETIPEPAAHLATARAEVAGTPAAWTEALQRWQSLGDPYRIACARTELAAAQLATGADRAFAAEHLASAAAAARELGAAHLLSRCEDLARRARLRVGAAPADNPYRLTGREREILALVAEGLTDRAIGGRLFISHRTVERHVSNLLAKLAAERRSELVATALREGLLAG